MSNVLKVGNVLAKMGDVKKGIIDGVELVNNVRVDLPVIAMNGSGKGPTLLILSTQHGIEIQGIETIHRVMWREVKPEDLRGRIIGIPVANPLAFMHHQYLSWIDNLDVGRVSALKPDGNTTEKIAHALWTEAWSQADMIINIHCNTRPDSLIYQWINVSNQCTRQNLERMAEAFGVTTIVSYEPPDDSIPTLGNLASREGKPVILEELIDGRWISEPSISAGVKGVLNIMKEFDMIDGHVEPQNGFPIVHGVNESYGIIRAKRGGLIRFFKTPGEYIEKDEIFAEVYDLYGDVLEEVKMPINGYVWAYPCGQSLGTSGSLQAVQSGANIAYAFTHEKDWPP
jgi:predicted deacylase